MDRHAQGTVTAIDGDRIVVEVSIDGCGGCRRQAACGAAPTQRSVRLRYVGEPPPPGSVVALAVDPERLVAAAALAYLWPVLALLAGALAGHLAAGDAGAALGGFAGFVGGLAVLRRSERAVGSTIAVVCGDRQDQAAAQSPSAMTQQLPPADLA